jgi:hypothetical protein
LVVSSASSAGCALEPLMGTNSDCLLGPVLEYWEKCLALDTVLGEALGPEARFNTKLGTGS